MTSIGNYVFSGCSSLTSIEIPNGVTSIGAAAFENCLNLTSIEIPNGVTSIGGWAFYGCSDLKSLIVQNKRPPISNNNIASQDVYDNCTLYIPEGSENAYYVADGWKYFKKIETIASGIETITADSKDVQYIQLNGMYTTELKPGLNIFRKKDGTTKKVWVK